MHSYTVLVPFLYMNLDVYHMSIVYVYKNCFASQICLVYNLCSVCTLHVEHLGTYTVCEYKSRHTNDVHSFMYS